ncbi:histidine kinase [Paenibacillus sp. FSL R10-2734]|uniref:sensor histidine kinase n=1 Tax=Paenibacillus sp. FSL R10-2734 TaxID=2954691 RepID=UPI0030D969FE
MLDLRHKIGGWFQQLTLKNRIALLFAASALIPFVSTVLLSYNAMSSILLSKLDSGVNSNLKQVQLSLESAYNNLNTVTQQLSIQSSTGYKLQQLILSHEEAEQQQLSTEIQEELSLLTFTNPTVGLALYYDANEGKIISESTSVKSIFSIDDLTSVISDRYGVLDFAPHLSYERYSNEKVVSALKKIEIPGRDNIYIYVESAYDLTKSILDSRISLQSFHLILDSSGKVAFSEDENIFKHGEQFLTLQEKDVSGQRKGYYWFEITSTQGWSIISLVPKASYNYERDKWVIQIFLIFLLFVVVIALISLLLWKMIYHPLREFNREIKWMSIGQFHRQSAVTHIPEFDSLLLQFSEMKIQISELFTEVEMKEKKRADLEIEKLLYQINPHFLMNTLDTIHWLAVINGQDEIDRLVSSLNKLLFYNLGKLGEQSTIREEIDSLNQYLLLQQIRYNFKFDMRIKVDERVMDVLVPRFILQPIVENALYHGLNDKGSIQVEVNRHDEDIVISIADNGSGISEEEIKRLLTEEQSDFRKVGMGIGMNYVKRMMQSYYEGRAKLDIESELGIGTTVYLTIPFLEKEETK